MRRRRTLFTHAVLSSTILFAFACAAAPGRLEDLSLTDLEQRLVELDAELEPLARASLRSGVGAVGWRSEPHTEPSNAEWVRIALEGEVTIDSVVLVPAIWRDTKTGFRADGFPAQFRIVAGTGGDTNGTVLAAVAAKDGLLPRIAPVVVSFPRTTASWVRLEATTLSPRAWDGKYILQLSEILVFSGEENVALRQPVVTRTPEPDQSGARQRKYLVDGFLPYLMDAYLGEQSLAFVSKVGIGNRPTLTIDLGAVHPLNRIHLHATDVSDTVPPSTPPDFGIPPRFVVAGAIRADFSDAESLTDYHAETVYDVGPIIMRRFHETPCRYVRLTAVEPYINTVHEPAGSQVGLAEIECFSRGTNVALGKPVDARFGADSTARSLAALTDGCNLYGQILPVRQWLEELARRHDLEAERPLVVAELNRHYARQKTKLVWMGRLTALLAAGIVVIALISRVVKMREIARMRERFAADLHDELGANLHAIGLLSDLAADAGDPEESAMLHERIRAVTERTGTAMRHCTDILEANELYTGLTADMRRAAGRIMAKLDHDFAVTGEDHLNRLKPRTRVDLFLFYKECLVNISRHSGATRFSTQITADGREVRLAVSDNGRGLPGADPRPIPASLRRRARLLRACVAVESPPDGGTRITLTLRARGWRMARDRKRG